jgi:aryl-alcohol dehydrogenase-like predicted oxidoreductase
VSPFGGKAPCIRPRSSAKVLLGWLLGGWRRAIGGDEATYRLVDLLAEVGRRKKATPAQIALAWLLAQKPWIVPIPGTRKLDRLEENIGAASVELTAEELREIDSTSSTITVQGACYPENLEGMTGR